MTEIEMSTTLDSSDNSASDLLRKVDSLQSAVQELDAVVKDLEEKHDITVKYTGSQNTLTIELSDK